MLETNLVEICVVLLWCLGVAAAIVAKPVSGLGPRYFAIIGVALAVPLIGTGIALLNLVFVRNDRKQATQRRSSTVSSPSE